jgi:hypothetical protein
VENNMNSRFLGPVIDASTSSETSIQEVLFTAGKISNFRVALVGGSPGTGDSYAFTVRRDPAGAEPAVSTGITCKIADSNTTCEDTKNLQAFAAGDAISVLATENNNPTTRPVFFRLDYQP